MSLTRPALPVGDQESVATAATFALAPRGIPHTFRNSGATEARLLVTITPAGLEKFFDQVGDPRTDRSATPPPATTEQVQKLIDAAPKDGLELHPSPAGA